MPVQIPGYLQGNGTKPLKQFQSQIPGLYDTSDLRQSTTNLEQSNMNQGAAIAAAATAAYQNRTQQSGGSQLGSGFAGAQAMLPFYAMNANLENQFSGQRLQNSQAQAGQMGDVAGQLAQLRQAHQGMLADYVGRQQQLGQNQSQFNSDLAFRQQQLASQNRQFNLGFFDSRDRYNNSQNTGGGSYQQVGSTAGLNQYPQGYGQAALPQGVSSRGYIPNSGPIKAATMNGNAMLSPTQPWDMSPSAIQGWGTASMGGGGGGKEPSGSSQDAFFNYMRMLQHSNRKAA